MTDGSGRCIHHLSPSSKTCCRYCRRYREYRVYEPLFVSVSCKARRLLSAPNPKTGYLAQILSREQNTKGRSFIFDRLHFDLRVEHLAERSEERRVGKECRSRCV